MDVGISCLLRGIEHRSEMRALFTLRYTACCFNCSAHVLTLQNIVWLSVSRHVTSCLHDTNLDYYQIIIIMVITYSTSEAGSCERRRVSQWSDSAPSVCPRSAHGPTHFLQSYRRNRYCVIWWPTGALHFGLYMFKFKLRSRIVTMIDC
jgi:hypothetical protein